MKRAQINQAFTYIAIALLIGVTAYFGTKAVFSLFEANCDQEKASFTRKIISYVDEYSDRGSVRTESLMGSCGAKQVCFVDSDRLGFSLPSLQSDNVMFEAVKDGTANVFVKGEFTEIVGLSGKLELEQDVAAGLDGETLCVDAQEGRFVLRFRGTGRRTLVEQG